MNKELINKVYAIIKDKGIKFITKKDIGLYINCRIKGNFKEMQGTKLYVNHGSEYCRMLEIVNMCS